ncbi:MAG: hypothetical protein P8103_02430 [Candidatus Thiodiazotropha sp.]
MLLRIISISLMLVVMSGCSTTSNMKSVIDPTLNQNGGITIIADTCIMRDEIGTDVADDYFVIAESKELSQAILNASSNYLAGSGVQVREAIIPFVCGAAHDKGNSNKLVADEANGDLKDIKQPFGINTQIKPDKEYTDALSILSTYTAQYLSGATASDYLVALDKIKTSAGIIANRTNSDKILLFNVSGTSISSGKAFGQSIGKFFVGLGTAVATAGLGTGYYAYYIPGGDIDAVYIGAAVIDLESGFISWSNSLSVFEDPFDADDISDDEVIDRLLFDMVHKSPAALSIAAESVEIVKNSIESNVFIADLAKPEKYDARCRGGSGIRNAQSIQRPIQEAFNRILKSAGRYDLENGTKLTGTLDKIALSTSPSDAWWDMELTLENEYGKSMTVQSHYDFESSFRGSAACMQSGEAFRSAIQSLIKDAINDPAFTNLLTRDAPELEQASMQTKE